jgi:glycerol kinase
LGGLAFPQVLSSNDVFGYTDVEGFFDQPIPVTGVMGDSHGALFGQRCFDKGMGKATFGTGTSIMVNIGEQPLLSNNGLVTSIAYAIDDKIEYCLEGNINSSGDTIRWLVNELGILESSKQSEEYARKVASSEGVYLVPAFYGLGAPHWDFDCSAIISGIRRDTNKFHITRAGLESIAYQIKDIFAAMEKDMNSAVKILNVDGGATNNNLLMQFVADMLGIDIGKNEIEEFSALGAAYAAGLSVGFWKDKKSLEQIPFATKIYRPEMSKENAAELYNGWRQAVKRCLQKYD